MEMFWISAAFANRNFVRGRAAFPPLLMVVHFWLLPSRADSGHKQRIRAGRTRVAFFEDFERPLSFLAGDCFRPPALAVAFTFLLVSEACEPADSAEAEASRLAVPPTFSAGE